MFLEIRDLTVHLLVDGPPEASPLVLLHSLGTNSHVWDGQVGELSRRFRVIRPDLRGHGLTTCTVGPYSMEIFAADLAALLDALGIGQTHLAGISIGGLIAQAFAAMHPKRLTSLVLVDTAIAIPPPQFWIGRAEKVRADGMGAIADNVLTRWVTPAFVKNPEAEGLRTMLLRTPVEGYAASAEAIATADLSASTKLLELSTLIIVGEHDQSTPVDAAHELNRAIEGSSLVIVENAAHIPLVENPKRITSAMIKFLTPEITDYYASGTEVRRQVLGEGHVAWSVENATDFDRDFQTFITRTAWGSIWARPGLDRRTRSLLTIAMLASLGHDEELKLHLRASKNTGATPADIGEALMQVAIYAGIPAANAAFRSAKKIFREMHT